MQVLKVDYLPGNSVALSLYRASYSETPWNRNILSSPQTHSLGPI